MAGIGKLHPMRRRAERLRREIKLINAKVALYIYLSRLEFNYRYIDSWIEEAEKDVANTLKKIKKGKLSKVEEAKVKRLLTAIYKAAIVYHRPFNEAYYDISGIKKGK